MAIVLFLIVLGILVLSHEFGHFLAAKKAGIRVDEFAFGFPPKIFERKFGETTYKINLLPFGGYVKIHGEDDKDDDTKNDPRSFVSKSPGIKALVIVAGVLFNILLAWAVTVGGFLIGAPVSTDSVPAGAQIQNVKVLIMDVQDNTPAKSIGLKVGDELIGFSNIKEVQNFINSNKGKEIEIKYKRDGKDFSAKATPVVNPSSDKGSLGIAMDEIGIVRLPIHKAIWEGTKATYYKVVFITQAIFNFFSQIFKGKAGFDQVAGPIGIVSATGSAAKMGLTFVLNLIAVLSINLAIINILPLPALDGGRLLFLVIEKIKGSPVSPKFSSIVHSVGLALLLLLMAIITLHDVIKLI
jgi:regulator of sigma E protease